MAAVDGLPWFGLQDFFKRKKQSSTTNVGRSILAFSKAFLKMAFLDKICYDYNIAIKMAASTFSRVTQL